MQQEASSPTGVSGSLVRWLVLLTAVAAVVPFAFSAQVSSSNGWPRPVIIPEPESVTGVNDPVVSLTGIWKISAEPPERYWTNEVTPDSWMDIRVPAQAQRVGLPRRTQNYVYKTRFEVPGEFQGRRVLLRFEGVTGTARVWVNGTELEGHHGGFTVWNRDITRLVAPGEEAWLTVNVEEPTAATSSNTYSGGIHREVKLMALPTSHFTRLQIDTDLDENYQHATLKVATAWAAEAPGTRAHAELVLTDPQGRNVPLSPERIELNADAPEAAVQIPITNPLKWEAEHPHLYQLRARLVVDGQAVQSLVCNVGFREVEVQGRRLLVNGREVKLRGAGQFDGDALLGMTLLPEDAERDVRLYKEANFNYVRPACYPATQAFLDACDRYGLFVEGECPVTFTRGSESDPELTPIFVQQAAEMVEVDRNHPSIIMWDLANESNYGVNIRRMHEYISAADPTRPIVYSWSHLVPPDEPLPYDIYSYHYPPYDADLGRPGVAVFNSAAVREVPATMPVLADEIAHPAAYDRDEMQRDPNVRNFWGESIRIFWDKMLVTEGALGAAIWGGVDHPITETRVFGWGLLDVWRRPKPEYWLTKKAYSPVRVNEGPIENPGAGRPVEVAVTNAFDFTNLNEVRVFWSVGAEMGSMRGPDVEPHQAGTLQLPERAWRDGDVVNLKFCGQDGGLIDEYNLPVNPAPVSFAQPQGPAPEVQEDADAMMIRGRDFELRFSKRTGSLERGSYRGQTLLNGGPYLSIIGADLEPWALRSITGSTDGGEAVVNIAGSHGPVAVRFAVRVDGHGLITTRYTLDAFPLEPPATAVVPWNRTNAGGYQEVGVSYQLAASVDRLAWHRRGLWSAYPSDHIGRNQGTAFRTGPGITARPGVEPRWPTAYDEKDFNLFGPEDVGGRGTDDFRSMKEYIWSACAYSLQEHAALRVESPGTDAVRLEVVDAQPDGDVRIYINNAWNYRNLGLGNYMKPPVIVQTGYSNQVRMRLTTAPSP